jgi:hypothetical protein
MMRMVMGAVVSCGGSVAVDGSGVGRCLIGACGDGG